MCFCWRESPRKGDSRSDQEQRKVKIKQERLKAFKLIDKVENILSSTEYDKELLCNKLNFYINRIGLNRTALAQKAKVSRSTVSRIFSDDDIFYKAHFKSILRICNSLCLSEVETYEIMSICGYVDKYFKHLSNEMIEFKDKQPNMKIRKYMQRAGIQLVSELESISGVCERTIYRMLKYTRKPKIMNLFSLCVALQLSASETLNLLGGFGLLEEFERLHIVFHFVLFDYFNAFELFENEDELDKIEWINGILELYESQKESNEFIRLGSKKI